MAIKWTPEQTKIIDLHNRNILVSAAAGSGKTAVLVERIVKMVESGIDIDRLIVVTFTNAAATEMRERLRVAIEKRIEKDAANQHLYRQLALINSAMICTIDSFCLDLVKNNFTNLNIDPTFKIADEAELKLLKADVMSQMLEDLYKSKDNKFKEFVYTYSTGKMDGGIDEIIYKLHKFAGAYPFPNKWLDKCKEAYEVCEIEFDLTDIKELASVSLEKLENNAFTLIGIADKKIEKIVECNNAAIVCAKQILEAQSYEQMYKAIKDEISVPRRDKNGSYEDIKEDIISFRDELKTIKKQYFFQNPKAMLLDIKEAYNTVALIIELVKEFNDRFQTAKKDKNIVDFNDVEHMALELLIKEDEAGNISYTELADQLSEYYEEILIDEYQDSNYLQEYILQSISKERKGQPNTFMVGDVKQSIYKFRLAKPELFMEKYDTYSNEDGLYQKIELHNNFRSRACVLDRVNDIFYMIMKKKLGNVEYNENVALNPTAYFADTNKNISKDTQVLVIEDSEDAKELEAIAIASKIVALTDEDNGLNVWDAKIDAYRTAKYSDIVILLRSTSSYAQDFLEALKSRNIPVVLESSTAYFEAKEVITVLNMLKLIDNPIQDIPLAASLLSYYGDFDSKELAIIRANSKNVSFYEAFMEFDADKEIVAKKEAFLALIKEYREKAIYLSARELIREIIYNTGYFDHAGKMGQGAQRQLNLDMLVETARRYESTSYTGIFNFLRYVDKVQQYEIDLGNSATSAENNAVRIMTIHKSKGLEFPIVFVSGMGKKINQRDSQGKIVVDSELGIGIDYINKDTREKTPTLNKTVIAERIKRENIAEELRVLYVALTRAKECLIMSGATKDYAKKEEKWMDFNDAYVSKCETYLDMIMPAVRNGKFKLNIYNKEEVLALDVKACEEEPVIEENSSFNKELFNKPYFYEKAVNLNSKMTVTEIKKMAHSIDDEDTFSLIEPEITPIVPKFISNEEKLDGAALGTLYHKVMECIAYDADIENELDRMAKKGYISKEDIKLIDISKIKAFMDTKEAKEIKEAYANGKLFRERQFILGVNASDISPEYEGIDETILVQGVIDMYYYHNDELVLLDYKTDRVKQYDNPKALLIDRYRKQLDYYKEALERLLGRAVNRMYIYSFDLNEMIEYKEN
ncbi:MAG: helicase-exonuclease AddAB subunit AddA [Lachnospiraceae bacterium]|nr:helicase-exonuclease AddAB subunit AddA [Lachnospiraceae bacterium]